MLLPPLQTINKEPFGNTLWILVLYSVWTPVRCLNSLEYFMGAMFECLTFIGCDAGLALKRLVLDNSLGFCPSFS